MKKHFSPSRFVRITALLLIIALLPSCGKNSLRKHDEPHTLNVVFMHVGSRYNNRITTYAAYSDDDLRRLAEIGVNEVCISYGSDVMAYTPEGADKPVAIVTTDDVYNGIDDTKIDCSNELTRYLLLQSVYAQKLESRNEHLYLEDFAKAALSLAERLVNINPDIKIWYSFPNILVQPLAEKYIEPYTLYYNNMKNSTPAEVWEKNIAGFYWTPEDIDNAMILNIKNRVDFDNPVVMAMKACGDLAHNDGKLFFWCPYYDNAVDTTAIGYVANLTDIFDYVILQPNHLFRENWSFNIDLVKNCAEQNAVLDERGNIIGGKKKSSTIVGPEIEMEGELFDGENGEEMKARYMDYYNAYHSKYGTWSFAFYVGERDSIMSDQVFEYLKEFYANPV